MTRDEFINQITFWYELIDFCNDYGCDVCSGIYDDDQRNECIDDELVDMARHNTWEELRDILNNYDTGYDYWYKDEYDGWVGLTDGDFDDYKDDVLSWADNSGDIWDEDEEQVTDEETIRWNNDVEEEPLRNIQCNTQSEPEDDTTSEDTGITFSELFLSCGNTLHEIYDKQAKEIAQENADFSKFIIEPASMCERRA